MLYLIPLRWGDFVKPVNTFGVVGKCEGEGWSSICGLDGWRPLRFLLRDGFVIAAAGTHPPWPPLLKGGKLGVAFAPGNLRS